MIPKVLPNFVKQLWAISSGRYISWKILCIDYLYKRWRGFSQCVLCSFSLNICGIIIHFTIIIVLFSGLSNRSKGLVYTSKHSYNGSVPVISQLLIYLHQLIIIIIHTCYMLLKEKMSIWLYTYKIFANNQTNSY